MHRVMNLNFKQASKSMRSIKLGSIETSVAITLAYLEVSWGSALSIK